MGDETKSSGGVAPVKEADTTALTVYGDGPGVWFRVSIGESVKESTRGLVMSGGKVIARRFTLQEEMAAVVNKTLKRTATMKPSELSKKNFHNSKQSKQTKLAKQNNEVVQNEVHQTLRTFMYGLALVCVFDVAYFAHRWRVAQNCNHIMPFTKKQLSPRTNASTNLLTTLSCSLCMSYRCLQVQSATSRDFLCGPVQKYNPQFHRQE